ncbi:MAG: DUF805 domain-containing protein [Deltaproteobacteria bacterium]|nr:DUF805 domain-containing protein [Deltaproteobacteria bacterium]
MRLVRLWFGSSGRVTRLDYVVSGVLLMALKYALDALAIYLSSGQILMPIDFMSPLFATRDRLLGGSAGVGTLLTMGLWALLFLWIGASMSVRRAIDGGLTPWIGLLFVFPFLNLLVIALLSFVPTSKTVSTWSKVAPSTESSIRSALFGVAAGAAIAMLGIGVSVLAFKEYGLMLFFATPFVIGVGHEPSLDVREVVTQIEVDAPPEMVWPNVRLKTLPNGGTLLEGSTWYTLDLHPAPYWALWSDALIHQIHQRVQRHIRHVTLRPTSHSRGETQHGHSASSRAPHA